MENSIMNAALFLGALHLLVLLILTSFYLWQFARLWRGKIQHTWQKLAAAGLTAALFPDVFYQVIIYPVYLLVNNLQYLFYACLQESQNGGIVKGSLVLDESTISVSQVIKKLPIAGSFEAAGVMVVIYYLIRRISAAGPALFILPGGWLKR